MTQPTREELAARRDAALRALAALARMPPRPGRARAAEAVLTELDEVEWRLGQADETGGADGAK